MFCDHNHHQGAGASTGHLGELEMRKRIQGQEKMKEAWNLKNLQEITFPSTPPSTRLLLEDLDGVAILKIKSVMVKSPTESSFAKIHLHIEALWCVTLIDSGPVEWEPDSLVSIRKFWISTIFLEVKKTPIWPKVLPGGQVQPVHNRWTSVFSELCVSWSWTVQCCHPVPSPGRSTKMQS